MTFLEPQHMLREEGALGLAPDIPVQCDVPIVLEAIQRALENAPQPDADEAPPARYVRFHAEVPEAVAARVCKTFEVDELSLDEGYILEVDEGIDAYAASPRGLFFAAQTLLQFTHGGALPRFFAYDYPVCRVRGLKLLLPHPEGLDEFRRCIDMICAYKYNTVMLEIGGAMEYKRHPEINEGWLEYAAEMNEYPGKGKKVQASYDWDKNSIHSSNGGGLVLSQDTVRDLVHYCRERFLDVIPEQPSLSHCDFLLTRHPELAERAEDPYPDTFCPSNPASYDLLFDTLEEIVEVFDPRTVNIGHDEYYSIALCEKCRGKSAPEIFADDVRKIHDWLEERGIQTMMWSEKLLDAFYTDGTPIGGAEKPRTPATWPAIDLVPRDIVMLHWYWSIDRNYELEYLKRDMPVIYGNFRAAGFPDWRERIGRQGVDGAIISNWGATDKDTLQRNNILFGIVYAAFYFWNRRYDDTRQAEVRDLALAELYRFHHLSPLSFDAADRPAHHIVVVHAALSERKYKNFVDGDYLRPEDFHLGDYVLTYDDGGQSRIPVVDGGNVASVDASWEIEQADNRDFMDFESLITEVAYTTLPHRVGDETWYEFRTADPRPEAQIVSIAFEPRDAAKGRVFLRAFARED